MTLNSSLFDFRFSYEFIIFAYRYLVPDEDLSSTWKLHGGLSGHIDYETRRTLTKEFDNQLLTKINQKMTELQPRMGEILKFKQFIHSCFEHWSQNSVSKQLQFEPPVKVELVTGFSRSGGTYLVNELARIRQIDLLSEGVYWSHDFYPIFSPSCYHSTSNINNYTKTYEIILYLACTLAHLANAKNKTVLKRTVMGAIIKPYIDILSHYIDGLDCSHTHIIRDINGVFLSMQKMFSGADSVTEKHFDQQYEQKHLIHDHFLKVATHWFIANLTILPNSALLPLLGRQIELTSADHIIRQVNLITDQHLKCAPKAQPNFTPARIIKFGSTTEMQITALIQEAGAPIESSQLNYSEKPQLDSPYQAVYLCYLNCLTRLYNHYGIDFDGVLERV